MEARPSQVQGIVDEAMRDIARATVAPIRRSMYEGSRIGMRAADEQHEQLTARGGPVRATARQRESFASPVTPGRAREIVQERIRGVGTPDGIPLSQRIYRDTREAGRRTAQVVRESIETRAGVFEASERVLAATDGNMRVELPRYIDRITDAARQARDTGDNTRLLEVIEEHRAQMNALGEGAGRADGMYSLRSSVRQFVADVQMRPADVEKLLERHVQDRLQFQARRLVRHETAEAMRAANLESLESKPYVKGIRWTLSPSHPRPDVCDLFASQALHGLGPGGYPLDEVPDTPHPLCLCSHESIIDEEHFTRANARRRGEPEPPRPWEDATQQTAREWLADQPRGFQRQVLGRTRLEIFERSVADREHVIDDRGRPIPVGIAVGRAGPRAR